MQMQDNKGMGNDATIPATCVHFFVIPSKKFKKVRRRPPVRRIDS